MCTQPLGAMLERYSHLTLIELAHLRNSSTRTGHGSSRNYLCCGRQDAWIVLIKVYGDREVHTVAQRIVSTQANANKQSLRSRTTLPHPISVNQPRNETSPPYTIHL